MINMFGRSNFGGGLLKIQTYELNDLLCLNPINIFFEDESILTSTSWEISSPSLSRRKIDSIIFDILDLKQWEREEVYEAVVELVMTRLEKARSI